MLEGFTVWIQALVISLGPLGVFLSMFLGSTVIPIPSEAVLVAAGVVGFQPIDIAVYGGLGLTAGGIAGYFMGAYGGRSFLDKYGKYFLITPERLETFDRWFQKWGDYSTLFSRLVPLVPYQVFSVAAGIARMNLIHFSIFTLIGSIPRAFLFGCLGSSLMMVENVTIVASVFAILFLLFVIIVRGKVGSKP